MGTLYDTVPHDKIVSLKGQESVCAISHVQHMSPDSTPCWSDIYRSVQLAVHVIYCRLQLHVVNRLAQPCWIKLKVTISHRSGYLNIDIVTVASGKCLVFVGYLRMRGVLQV